MDFSHILDGSVLITAAISALVSGIIAVMFDAVLGARFKKALDSELEKERHTYKMNIEMLRQTHQRELAEIESKICQKDEIARNALERRYLVCSRVVESVYRTRNLARSIIIEEDADLQLMEELRVRTSELEDLLFVYRIDLESDSVFLPIHNYKNTLRALVSAVANKREQCVGDSSEADQHSSIEITRLYADIDDECKSLVSSLSALIRTPIVMDTQTR